MVEADAGSAAARPLAVWERNPRDLRPRKLVDGADLQIPFSSDFLAVSNDFYKRSPKSVERIVMAYADGAAGAFELGNRRP